VLSKLFNYDYFYFLMIFELNSPFSTSERGIQTTEINHVASIITFGVQLLMIFELNTPHCTGESGIETSEINHTCTCTW